MEKIFKYGFGQLKIILNETSLSYKEPGKNMETLNLSEVIDAIYVPGKLYGLVTILTKEDTNNLNKCSKCGSDQLSSDKKGFSVGQAAVGVVLKGGIGLLGGLIGKDKVLITCLKCGNNWIAGEGVGKKIKCPKLKKSQEVTEELSKYIKSLH